METERLYFKKYEKDDFPFFASLWADPEVVQYIGKGVTRSEAEAFRSFNEWLLPGYRDGRGLYLIIHKESGNPIGHAGVVSQAVEGKREYEIGYWLSKENWGQGYGLEAALFFKQYAHEVLGLDRLICLIQNRHKKSVRIALELGMSLEKTTNFNAVPVNVYAWNADK